MQQTTNGLHTANNNKYENVRQNNTDTQLRQDILTCTQEWLGTPYRHQMAQKGVGCDCLGLVRGVWREIFGYELAKPPPYTPDWAEKHGQETLKQAADIYLTSLTLQEVQCGDVILFRMQPQAPAKHMAILYTKHSIIHAYWGRAVSISPLSLFWRKRQAYAYSFTKETL